MKYNEISGKQRDCTGMSPDTLTDMIAKLTNVVMALQLEMYILKIPKSGTKKNIIELTQSGLKHERQEKSKQRDHVQYETRIHVVDHVVEGLTLNR